VGFVYEASAPWAFPPDYATDLVTTFQVGFIGSNTIRLRFGTNARKADGLMIETMPEENAGSHINGIFRNGDMEVRLAVKPFSLAIMHKGKQILKSVTIDDSTSLQNSSATPFSISKKLGDLSKSMAASFTLAHDEKIFGCGESFTRLDKRGQRVNLCAIDPLSAQTSAMYKPIPFFMSSKGYGMFVHTSSPVTFDFGNTYDAVNTIYAQDDSLDLFFFLGDPKSILSAYTDLTGRASMPPAWSFGLWMSRITYKSQDEVMTVARELRRHRIPCDVIHLDTGWFETEWRCDYQFSKTRFPNPDEMISILLKMGFHISLWQLPYLTPENPLYQESINRGFVVLNPDGGSAVDDAVIDFSNPDAVNWYQNLLTPLLAIGVGAIKADFGEAAPIHGCYHSRRSGMHEHNLYPLRYNKAVSEITRKITGSGLIWARSAWAGSQRYPVMWGGDAENTDSAMAATLRAGLSLGLCGFSFWSHDIGGFVRTPDKELYRRWLPFGMLTSHSRCHGAPPKEPWAFGEDFIDYFRKVVELKYVLMPYILAQASLCCLHGHPMIRPLFFEYPEDPSSYGIEDQYMFGESLLVAPAFGEACGRSVYLPEGTWTNYLTGEKFHGKQHVLIEYTDIPIVMMIRDGHCVATTQVMQSTQFMELSK
jgi:alpha-D-xyloside xylohydrolase